MITSLSRNPIVRQALQRYRKDWRFAAGIILSIVGYSPLAVTIGYAVFSLLALIIGSIMLIIGSLIVPYFLDEPQAQEFQRVYDEALAEIVNLTPADIYLFLGELYEATELFLFEVLPVIAGGIFYSSLFLLLFLLILFAPITTTALISGERQRQTLDVLRITLLSSLKIVVGKLTTGVMYLLLPLATIWILFMLCFAMRGVSIVEVVIAWLLLLITAVSLATVGLVASTLSKSMTGSLMTAYGLFLPGLFLFPSLGMFVISIILAVLNDAGFAWSEPLLFYGWGLVACLNPFSAGATSLAIYQESGAIFFVVPSAAFDGYFYPLPWLIYSLFYPIFSWILVEFSIWRLKRLNRN